MQITPMLGENITKYPESVLDGKLWRMSEKIDGVRRMFHKHSDGSITAVSRSGIADPFLLHIFEFLESPWFPVDTVYDCELVDRELYFKKVPSFELRQNTNSITSQQYGDNKHELMAICFDVFRTGGDTRRAEERDKELYSLFSRGRPEDPMIKVPMLGNVFGADMATIKMAMNIVINCRKGEGLMLLDMDSMYTPGRSKSLLKIKQMKDFIGRVVDVEMARPGTKIEGMVAALICEVKGCTVPVRVGSGLNNEERINMTITSPIGKDIEIEAFSYSKNRKGGVSLNLPIFKKLVE